MNLIVKLIPLLTSFVASAANCLIVVNGTTTLGDNGNFLGAADGYITVASGTTGVATSSGQTYVHSISGTTTANAAQCILDIPSNIGLVISNRWMASTNTVGTNGATVTDWPDETNHFHWVYPGGGTAPTNNATFGVMLNEGSSLYGTNTLKNANAVRFYIYNFIYTGNSGYNGPLFQDRNRGLGFGYMVSGSSQPYRWQNSPSVPFTTNTINSLIAFASAGDGSAGTFYTNGVLATTGLTTYAISGDCIIGCGATNSGGTTCFVGYLKELILFTDTSITSSQVSNLNYYANHLYW